MLEYIVSVLQRPELYVQILFLIILYGLVPLLHRIYFSKISSGYLIPFGCLSSFALAGAIHFFALPNRFLVVNGAILGAISILALSEILAGKIFGSLSVRHFMTVFARPAVIVVSLILIIKASGFDPLWSIKVWDYKVGEGEIRVVSIAELVRSVGLIYAAIISLPLVDAAVSFFARIVLQSTAQSAKIIANLFGYIFVAVVFVLILVSLGIRSTILLTVLASFSAGLGFGLRDLAANFISGIWLMLEGSIRPGDVIVVDSDACRVEALSPRAARLWRQRDNAELFIPNNEFFSNQTVSYSRLGRKRRCEIRIYTATCYQPDHIIELLESIPGSIEGVCQKSTVTAFVVDQNALSIEYSLRYFLDDPLKSLTATSRVRQAVWTCFKDNDIEVPLPKQIIQSSRRQRTD